MQAPSTKSVKALKFRLSEAQFKCLIFVCGLGSAGDTEVRTRILSKIEQNPNITPQQVTVECQRLVNFKHDSHIVQQSVPATTPAVNAVQKQQNPTSPSSTHKKLPSACWNCGGWLESVHSRHTALASVKATTVHRITKNNNT